MQARRHLMRLSNGHDRENNTTQQLQASKTPLLVTHRQTEYANINKTMFESDTPCGRSVYNVSNVITQPIVYDRAKNTMQRLKTSKRIFAQVSESFD
ncbi:hypothetical protein CTI12_AA368860 [Artemisia annua]|uniref:Uncharacterized protein n=1 Tax=Artemisia annua TaxID=35608 RepID=A0A2U1MJ15_ARTAN|nr:hypothetical protein CTI12_AA368860 [Artemisia annua]